MTKRKLGIIGGMGPLATKIFYGRIIENTKASKDQDHIYTIISSHSTMPDRTSVILQNLDNKVVLDAVKEDLKIMELAKVDRIVIPCNTFHYFYEDVQDLTDIPIINMIDEAMKSFKDKFGNKAVVLSTTGTFQSGVYKKYADIYDIELIEIAENFVDRINNIIYEIKSTNIVDRPEFIELLNELAQLYNPDGFVLACTELSLVPLDEFKNTHVLDAMDVLVKEAIIQTGYELSK